LITNIEKMSSIKGGGRALLSSDIEDQIIALLYDLRDPKNPLLSRREKIDKNEVMDELKELKVKEKEADADAKTKIIPFNDLSSHDQKKAKKKFLKRLVNCHDHQVLAMKLNAAKNDHNDNENYNDDDSYDGDDGDDIRNHSDILKQASTKAKSGKVRIDIVEAIYKEKTTSKGSSSSKSSKSRSSLKSKKAKNESRWSEGSTRKTIVLDRSTTITVLMTQCKSKLKMKKKPSRVFFVDIDSKIEMDLTNDLSGIDDGTLIYVTSYAVNNVSSPQPDDKIKEDDKDSDNEDEKLNVIDPLDAVKKVYKLHKRKLNKNRCEQQITENLPSFTESLDDLEPLPNARLDLPAANYRSKILSALDTSRVLVICGATGCGKSTQVPQYILEGMKAIGYEGEANILVTQPRRVAATSLAMRVSKERNSPPPGKSKSEIGYNVRLAKATSENTKITYCTVGVLLRMLVNPMEDEDYNDVDNETTSTSSIRLHSISHVVIDEVHERDLNTDFVLTLLRPLLSINKRISIILMSATASSSLFANYFRNNKLGIEPCVLNIPGRTFPVETKWISECEKIVSQRLNGWSNESQSNDITNSNSNGVQLSPRVSSKIDNEFIVSLIKALSKVEWDKDEEIQMSGNSNIDKTCGAILVFLPGKGEIDTLSRMLKQSLGDTRKCKVLHLHSSLSPSEQWSAFQPVQHGNVKVVLATNVAETSITIPDVSVVIDTGRVKESRFNASTRIKELVTVWTSLASSKQRAGRAGRTAPGTCYKLYSEDFTQNVMLQQTPPEIVRTPLEELILQVCLLEEQKASKSISPMNFLSQAPEPPPVSNLNEACGHLIEIGALKSSIEEKQHVYRLTPLGYHLAHLPMDPKVGKILIVGCVLQCIEPALIIASTLSSSKSCWLQYLPGHPNSRDKAHQLHEDLIRTGFGGENWPHGGVAKGDLISVIAAYHSWDTCSKNIKDQRRFALENALDYNALIEIKSLCNQYREVLRASGLLCHQRKDHDSSEWTKYSTMISSSSSSSSSSSDLDPLLTSCCLVAGLYPNIATLMRPSREKYVRYGRLITKEGDSCRASSSSFQGKRIKNASESGKDVYAVYHSKHCTVGTTQTATIKEKDNIHKEKNQDIFLSEINFVSRFAILLFGGQIEVQKNYILVDEWLKFKVHNDDSSRPNIDDRMKTKTSKESKSSSEKVAYRSNAILIQELRKELDNVLLKRIMSERTQNGDVLEDECKNVIDVVNKLLSE